MPVTPLRAASIITGGSIAKPPVAQLTESFRCRPLVVNHDPPLPFAAVSKNELWGSNANGRSHSVHPNRHLDNLNLVQVSVHRRKVTFSTEEF